jgi:tRNA dimethylallyltransferase
MNGIVIIGPTASGKSSLGMRLAGHLGGEIVSIDSRQIYRGLDIGTAKATAAERARIRHHCIDILDITEKSNARWFADIAREAIGNIRSKGKIPVLVGGSGLYLRSITHGLFDIDLDPVKRKDFENRTGGIRTPDLHSRLKESDPASAERIHVNDRYRILRALEIFELTGTPISEHFRLQQETGEDGMQGLVKIGLDFDRELLRSRIMERTGEMYDAGWPDEVSSLLESGADPDCPGLQTLGYPETAGYVRGEMERSEAIERIAILTSQYAKRQMTWFRKEEDVSWLDAGSMDLFEAALNVLDREGNS